jgi:tRNA (guanine10-N2)-dimethyltransferase
MRLLFELSGEHPSLPIAEVISCFNSEKLKFEVLGHDKRILIVDAEQSSLSILENRIALTHNINQLLIITRNFKDIVNAVGKLDFGNNTFAIRCKSIGFKMCSSDIERKIGSHCSGEVDLENPDIEIRILLTDRWYLCIKKAKINRADFEKRKVLYRPFFSPISIHPRLARTLVNLAEVKKSDTVLDPFCGTGGILIEAGLIGCKLIGSDANSKIISGAKKNIKDIGLDATLICSDISDVNKHVESVDAVVTDPPYGRAASTCGETLQSLYTRMFPIIRKVLKSNGYLVIILPGEKFVRLGKNYMTLSAVYRQKVHKSLTRHICVFKR